jgi:hypothetical protein
VTTAGTREPLPGASPALLAEHRTLTLLRLPWLYLVSRRVPAALGLLAGLAVLLWIALHWHWGIAGGPAAQQFISLTIETGAAAVIAVTTYGPFGDPEQASGRWLPWLRLGAAVALTAVAFGALAAGATGGMLPGGTLPLLRNLAGGTGIGLVATEVALDGRPATPWVWAARPPHDLGGALCAGLLFAAGAAVIAVFGARDSGRHAASG